MCVRACVFTAIGGFYQCLEVNNKLITSAVMILSLIVYREWPDERRIEISFECYVNHVTSPAQLYFTCIVQKGGGGECLLQRVSFIDMIWYIC
jgi:hypothetical protein